jgi:hypothetical protein
MFKIGRHHHRTIHTLSHARLLISTLSSLLYVLSIYYYIQYVYNMRGGQQIPTKADAGELIHN